MARLSRSVRFSDCAEIAEWALPHVGFSDSYRLQLLIHAGLKVMHEAGLIEAQKYLLPLEEILRDPAADLGVDERANAVATLAADTFNLAEPEAGLRILATAPPLDLCTIPNRVRVHGTRCELLRFVGRFDEAVQAGEEATRLACAGFSSEAGRDMNYLIHALLRRQKPGDIERAKLLLVDSREKWAPDDDMAARVSHLGFCQHYEAEIARLETKHFELEKAPLSMGHWTHARLFVLLACARNRGHFEARRTMFARQLVSETAGRCGPRRGVFDLLRIVYTLYLDALEQGNLRPGAAELALWCEDLGREGQPGWSRLLSPLLACNPDAAWTERLCDTIPYH